MKKIKLITITVFLSLTVTSQNISIHQAMQCIKTDNSDIYIKLLTKKEVIKHLKKLKFKLYRTEKVKGTQEEVKKYSFTNNSKSILILLVDDRTRKLALVAFRKSTYEAWKKEFKSMGFIQDNKLYSKKYPCYTYNNKYQIKDIGLNKDKGSYQILIQVHPYQYIKRIKELQENR